MGKCLLNLPFINIKTVTVCCHMEVYMFISSVTILPKVVISFLQLMFVMILISAGRAT